MRTRVATSSVLESDLGIGNPPTPAQPLSLVTQALSELVQLVPVLTTMLTAVRSEDPKKTPAERPDADDRALSAAQAGAMIGVSPQWLYRHTRTLPFTRKLSRKKTVYSEAAFAAGSRCGGQPPESGSATQWRANL
jgi:hypothetical protein